VNVVLLCAIIIAGGLLIPPLVGVYTVMIDDANIDTNLPVGSVTYAKRISVTELEVGNKILIADDSATYEFKIDDMDVSAEMYRVTDTYNSSKEVQTVTLGTEVLTPVLTIPFIAYAAMAVKSTEGLIIIGLGAIFLIILFILSELWKKDPAEDEEDEAEEAFESEEEDGKEKSRRQLRKEAKQAKKAAKRAKKNPEADEEDDEIEEKESKNIPSPGSAEAVMQETMAAIAIGVTQVKSEEENPVYETPKQEEEIGGETTNLIEDEKETGNFGETLEIPQEQQEEIEAWQEKPPLFEEEQVEEQIKEQIKEQIIEQTEEQIDDKERVPITPTAESLIARAAVEGEEPDIVEDEELGVTLLDYSELI